MPATNLENYAKRNMKNSRSMLIWSILWAASLAVACFALKFWGPQNEVMLALSAIIHLCCAFGALKAHQVWLKELDELQQKIQLKSMAYTLGLTWIGITLLILISSSEVVEIGKFSLPILALGMAIVGVLGNLIGIRKAT